jgi:thiol-disulfide isomerase/thioredoxin
MNPIFSIWKRMNRINRVLFVLCSLISIYYIFFRNTSFIDNFGNPVSCTYYYMDNCGYCKKFTPEWDKFVKNYKGNIKFKKINMQNAETDIEKYNIKGFPTVLIMDEEGEVKEYDGDRTSAGLEKYFKDM